MIDWIHEGCKNWGWQIRVVHLGKDGWPSRSVLGRMMEEGVLGASAGQFTQFLPECLNEEALRFNNAIKTLNEEDRTWLFIHYCVIGKGKVKASRMDVSRTVYYDKIDAIHGRLSGALHAQGRRDAEISKRQASEELASLKKTLASGQNSQICRRTEGVADASFAVA